MKRLGLLITVGIAAFVVFAIATAPATLVFAQLQDSSIRAIGVEGTVWEGRAQVVQIGNASLGRLEWDVHPLSLLGLELTADLKLTRADGFAQGQLTTGLSQSVEFQDLTASLPLSALPIGLAGANSSGTLNLKLAQLVLNEGWPVHAVGTADAVNVSGGGLQPPATASYRLLFPAPNAEADAGTLIAAVTDLDGPLQVSGTLRLTPDRSYHLDALVAPRPDAPRELTQGLQMLGAPDAQGRYQLTLEGTM